MHRFEGHAAERPSRGCRPSPPSTPHWARYWRSGIGRHLPARADVLRVRPAVDPHHPGRWLGRAASAGSVDGGMERGGAVGRQQLDQLGRLEPLTRAAVVRGAWIVIVPPSRVRTATMAACSRSDHVSTHRSPSRADAPTACQPGSAERRCGLDDRRGRVQRDGVQVALRRPRRGCRRRAPRPWPAETRDHVGHHPRPRRSGRGPAPRRRPAARGAGSRSAPTRAGSGRRGGRGCAVVEVEPRLRLLGPDELGRRIGADAMPAQRALLARQHGHQPPAARRAARRARGSRRARARGRPPEPPARRSRRPAG